MTDAKYKAKLLAILQHGQEFTFKNDLLSEVEITCPECGKTQIGCISNAELPPRWGFCIINMLPSNRYQLRCETCECLFNVLIEEN